MPEEVRGGVCILAAVLSFSLLVGAWSGGSEGHLALKKGRMSNEESTKSNPNQTGRRAFYLPLGNGSLVTEASEDFGAPPDDVTASRAASLEPPETLEALASKGVCVLGVEGV